MCPEKKWIVLGVSGVTCGGKSTFAEGVHNAFHGSVLIHQDDYFLPIDDKRHTHIPLLSHINWEILSSLDMEKLRNDIKEILSMPVTGSTVPLLIVEGFLIFTDPFISSVCHLKIFFTLSQEECWARRSARTYNPPDVPGYFKDIIWPEYERHLELALKLNSDLAIYSGKDDFKHIEENVKCAINNKIT